MFALPGYIIHEKISENDKVKVFKGLIASSQVPVIIKVLERETATPTDLSDFVYEYELTRHLRIEGFTKPLKLEYIGNKIAVIIEDSKAIPLRQYIKNNPIKIPDFLSMAIQLAQIFGELHQNGIIHSNLNLDNILVNPGTGEVKLSNIGSAGKFFKSQNEYMSPEQLGISKDGIDHRSNFYSLGVVLYQILTGQLPLYAESFEEWIRVHSSKIPETPDKINRDIPPALSAIVLKLLSKTADERYQTAHGLVRDLEECKRQWNASGTIKPFVLGKADASHRFKIPSRLFGREEEAKTLKTAFKHAFNGNGELVLISGYAGIGKTMLINEVLKPIAMEKGYFAWGKFDQLRKNIPYAPYVDALGSVIRQLMTENKEKLEVWRNKILHALGNSGSVLTELIPELKIIIGKQPPAEILQPKEAQTRFQMLFGNFIKVFAEMNITLVLFLDDLQWADMASLRLLRFLCEYTGLDHLLIIGAYRDNEINDNHPLMINIEELRNEKIPLREIYIGSLNRKEVTEFIDEALHCHEEMLDMLAETLYRKTCGNPFYLSQMLNSIYEEKLITFNFQKGCWECETESIQKLHFPGDVVDFIYLKLQKLPKKTLDILKIASCMGSTFDIKILSVVCEKTPVETYSILLPAIMDGLIMPVSHSGRVLQTIYNYSVVDINEFLHDRVRQAVYSLFSEKEKKETHVKIGRKILQNFYNDESDDGILPIVDHFNRGLELISDPAERLKIAGYNLEAGRKAKSSAAYETARNCFKAGIKLLPENAWDSCYPLCYDLHFECAQCEYMVGNVDETEKLFDLIIQRAKTEFERVDLLGMKMILYAGIGKYLEAVQIGINAMKILCVELPEKPGAIDNAREMLIYKWHKRKMKVEDLYKLPEMKDPVQLKVAELLTKLILVTCTNHPDLYSFFVLKMGNHALRCGNSEMASIGYIGYSIIEGSILGNYETGHEIIKVAIALAEKYGKNFCKCIVYFTTGAMILHWTHHAKEGLEYLEKAINCAFETGDVLMAGFAYGVILENKYLLGTHLKEILDDAKNCSEYAAKVKHKNLDINALAYKRVASILSNQNKKLTSIEIQNINEKELELLKSIEGDKSSLVAHYYTQMQLCYLTGNYREAFLLAERIGSFEGVILGFLMCAECNYYHSLSITALYGEMSATDRKRLNKVLKKNQRQMKKWANSCPANFMHKYLLIEAEAARILSKRLEAVSLYDKAIQSARESGYIQNEAIACELAASFYANEGRHKVAKTYMSDAFDLYNKWGATSKALDLKWRYPDLLDEVEKDEKGDSVEIVKNILGYSNVNKNTVVNGIDIRTIQKVIADITEQVSINKLLETFMNTEFYASKAYLILKKDGEFFIVAAKDNENSSTLILKSVPLGKTENISKSIVRYVARTLETVIWNDNGHTGIFVKDPYITQSDVKSIACIPLQFYGVSIGVLYLENDLMTGVFSEERLGIIKMLAEWMIHTKTFQEFMEGSRLEIKEAIQPLLNLLTEKETEVIKLVSEGLSNKEIAERLDISTNTVKTHLKNIYEKLQVNRRVQAVEKAKSLNLL